MSDYNENLSEAFEIYTQSSREEHEAGEFDCLDIEVWKKEGSDERKVEFILTCGGPTVWVQVDEAERVTFHHSWGCNSIGEKFTENTFSGEDAEFWVMLADEFAYC